MLKRTSAILLAAQQELLDSAAACKSSDYPTFGEKKTKKKNLPFLFDVIFFQCAAACTVWHVGLWLPV